MTLNRQQRPLRALTAAACFTAGALFGGNVLQSNPGPAVNAAALFPLQKKGEQAAPTTPGQQRAKMIKLLESIDKRMGSVDSHLSDVKSSLGSNDSEEADS